MLTVALAFALTKSAVLAAAPAPVNVQVLPDGGTKRRGGGRDDEDDR